MVGHDAQINPDIDRPIPRRGMGDFPYIFLLVMLVGMLFAGTVLMRRPWYGELFCGIHQWLTGSTLKYTTYWYEEGPVRLHFLMLENPRSVEFPTLRSRAIYPSYTGAYLVPVYLAAKFSGHAPTLRLIMGVNLVDHLLVALALALSVFLLVRYLGRPPVHALLFSIPPPLIVLLSPAPLYWHQNVYGPDQAAMLPFALVILTEVLLYGARDRRRARVLHALQAGLLFLGMLTDWLFLFVTVALFLKRLLCGEFAGTRIRQVAGRIVLFGLPTLLAIGLYLGLYQSVGVLGDAFHRAAVRAGAIADGQAYIFNIDASKGVGVLPARIVEPCFRWMGHLREQHHPLACALYFSVRFWFGHIRSGYGILAVPLLWGSLLCWLWYAARVGWLACMRRPVSQSYRLLVGLLGMAMLPAWMQVYTLMNHSAEHEFSALKFVVPLALAPFSLLPLLWSERHRSAGVGEGRFSGRLLAVNVLLLAMAGGMLWTTHGQFRHFLQPPDPSWPLLAEYVRNRHFGYCDVVFSPDFAIPENPPEMLAIARKRVYLLTSPADIRRVTAAIREPYRIQIIRSPLK